METALSFLYFKEKNCDIVVLETGLGGALDATNVVKTTVLEVIASISMDHMEFLGDTLDQIAMQKAGIIKPHTRVVSAMQQPEAAWVIAQVCRERACTLQTVEPEQIVRGAYDFEKQTFSYKTWKNVQIALAGSYQVLNAALALEAVEALRESGYALSEDQVYGGLAKAQWRGRFTLIHREPAVIMDGAHNPAAALELRRSLELYLKGKKLHYICGVFRDKDYKKVIELTAPLAEHIITVQTPDNPRALPAEELKLAVAEVNPSVEAAAGVAEAVEKSLKNAGKEDAIIIFGSLSFLGEAEKAVKGYKGE